MCISQLAISCFLLLVCSPELPGSSVEQPGEITDHTPLKLEGHFVRFHPRPAHPYEARSQHLGGRSIIVLYVRADGVVYDAKIVRSTGHKLLDEEAIRGAKKWRFRPEKASFIVHLPLTYEMAPTRNQSLQPRDSVIIADGS